MDTRWPSQPEGGDRRLLDTTGGAVVRQKLGRRDIALARSEADTQAAQRVAVGEVPTDVLGVGVVALNVGAKGPAELLDVPVGDQEVARAGAEVEQSRRRPSCRRKYGSRSKLSTCRPMRRPLVESCVVVAASAGLVWYSPGVPWASRRGVSQGGRRSPGGPPRRS